MARDRKQHAGNLSTRLQRIRMTSTLSAGSNTRHTGMITEGNHKSRSPQFPDGVYSIDAEVGFSDSYTVVMVVKENEDTSMIQSMVRLQIFSPVRRITLPAQPPKLHYTTWWRRITKRLYRLRTRNEGCKPDTAVNPATN